MNRFDTMSTLLFLLAERTKSPIRRQQQDKVRPIVVKYEAIYRSPFYFKINFLTITLLFNDYPSF